MLGRIVKLKVENGNAEENGVETSLLDIVNSAGGTSASNAGSAGVGRTYDYKTLAGLDLPEAVDAARKEVRQIVETKLRAKISYTFRFFIAAIFERSRVRGVVRHEQGGVRGVGAVEEDQP